MGQGQGGGQELEGGQEQLGKGVPLEDEPGEVLGFIRHGEVGLPLEFSRQEGKHLQPVSRYSTL